MHKIGVFDSGLGGLWMLKHLRLAIPQYDYVFYGDSKNVPYGEKTISELLEITKNALDFLFIKQNCKIVILACNTVSTSIYKELQDWVNNKHPDRIILGLVEPTVKSLESLPNLFICATTRTIKSNVYQKELIHIKDIIACAMPDLARIVERGEDAFSYLIQFQGKIPNNIENIALLCTHYGVVLNEFKKVFPDIKNWYCQENIIPLYLKKYLDSKPEISGLLSKNNNIEIFVSAENSVFDSFLEKWFPGSVIQNEQS